MDRSEDDQNEKTKRKTSKRNESERRQANGENGHSLPKKTRQSVALIRGALKVM